MSKLPMLFTTLLFPALAQSADCTELTDRLGSAWWASSALQEIARSERIAEHEVGAVLVLYDERSCDVLVRDDRNGKLAEAERKVLESRCSIKVNLDHGTEAEYLETARKAASWSTATLVALAWAAPPPAPEEGESRPANDSSADHVLVLGNADATYRVVTAGYALGLSLKARSCTAPMFGLARKTAG